MDDSGLRTLLGQLPMFGLNATPRPTSGNNIFVDILVVLLLILVNGFFAASEMSIVTLNPTKVRREAEDGDQSAVRILPFIDKPGNFMATIQVMITFAGFLSSAFAGERFTSLIVQKIDPLGNLLWLDTVILIAITILISYLSLVFGELIPKRIAMNNPARYAKRFAKVILFFDRTMRFFTTILNFSTSAILRLLNIPDKPEDEAVTEEEIRMMVDVGSVSGNIHVTEGEMIENIFEFNDKEVSEIMTHRTNIVGLPLDADLDACIDLVTNERYSRFPVYDEDIDDIVGILNIKDLLSYIADRTNEKFKLSEIIREPYLVPESKHVDQLLMEMRIERVSVAIAIDEYGGTAGLVSIEDLLEEIVGDIEDEYDEGQIGLTELSDGTFMVDGLMLLEDLERIQENVDFDEETINDFDTIAGLVLDLLGYIPDDDEYPTVVYKNLLLQVKAMDDNRIAMIQMTVQPLDEYYKMLEDQARRELEIREEQERAEQESSSDRDSDSSGKRSDSKNGRDDVS